MRSVILIARNDGYDTAPGLIVEGTPDLDDDMSAARSGDLIAHDVLEHVNGVRSIGPVWDELEALGAAWYVRGRWGDMLNERRSVWTPQQNLAGDVTYMFGAYSCDPDTGPGGLRVGSIAHEHDDAFLEIVAHARARIPREHKDMGRGDPDEDENGWSPELHTTFEEYLTLALHRMRNGYRKAHARYSRAGRSDYYAADTFVAIRDALKDVRPEYEGQRFRLRYGNCEATCEEIQEGGA